MLLFSLSVYKTLKCILRDLYFCLVRQFVLFCCCSFISILILLHSKMLNHVLKSLGALCSVGAEQSLRALTALPENRTFASIARSASCPER